MSEIYQPAEDSYLLLSVLEKIIPSILHKRKNLKFLEIGAGGGIHLEKALELGIKKENILGTDINSEAVKYCRSLGFKCIKSNLFSYVKGKYDLIIFNPPYLPADEDGKEPKSSQVATTGGKQGGEIINKFLKQAGKHLSENGKIILLISSLTRGIDFLRYNKIIVAEKKLFFEKLDVFELSL